MAVFSSASTVAKETVGVAAASAGAASTAGSTRDTSLPTTALVEALLVEASEAAGLPRTAARRRVAGTSRKRAAGCGELLLVATSR